MIDIFKEVLPIDIKSVTKGYGSFITLDFKQKKTNKKPDHLWVYLCSWSLFKGDVMILSSDDEDESKHIKCFNQMADISFVSAELIDRDIFTFYFSDDFKLILKADVVNYEKDDEMFLFYYNDCNILSYSFQEGFLLTEDE